MLAMPKTCIVLRCIVAPEQMTAVWIAGEIAECKKQLAEKDVFVFQTVADNASNMRAAEENGFILRCSAHCIQLAVKDILPVYSGAHALATELRLAGHKIEAANQTRWNTTLREIAQAVKFATAADDVHRLSKAVEILEPFRKATDAVQGDFATLFSSIAAWEELQRTSDASVLAAVTKRFEYMATEPYLLLAYFAPTVVGGVELEEQVGMALLVFDKEVTGDFETWKTTIFNTVQPPITAAAYDEHLRKIRPRMPRLAKLLHHLLRATPTEACVERGFSMLKHLFDDYRNRLSEENLEAQMVVKTAWQALSEGASRVVEGSPPAKRPRSESVEAVEEYNTSSSRRVHLREAGEGARRQVLHRVRAVFHPGKCQLRTYRA
jgi:hypothetical protein